MYQISKPARTSVANASTICGYLSRAIECDRSIDFLRLGRVGEDDECEDAEVSGARST